VPTAHRDETHRAVALGTEHVVPQPPQFIRSVTSETSHPFAARPSQFAKPPWHDATTHWLDAHAAVALAVTQAELHEPQCATSDRRSTSQPSAAIALQSPKPSVQAALHTPA
jgi:hypothetical protein